MRKNLNILILQKQNYFLLKKKGFIAKIKFIANKVSIAKFNN